MAFSPFALTRAPRPTNPRADLHTSAQMEEHARILDRILQGADASLAKAIRERVDAGMRYESASREEFEALFGPADGGER